MPWLIYFFTAFLISFLLGGILTLLCKKTSNKKTIRLGGAVIIAAFLIATLLNPELILSNQIVAILIGSVMILVVGVVDDFADLNWKKLFLFQIILAIILIFFEFSVDYVAGFSGEMIRLDFWHFGAHSIISVIFIVGWLLSVINAVGWSDGVDGLSGVIAIVSAAALFSTSLLQQVNQPALAILAIVFAGAVLGFWVWNLPRAKIEAGTAGSYFIGFFIASMAIIAGTKIAAVMIVLAVPLVDFVWVIVERHRAGKSIFKKDQRHLHYKLRRLGWSDQGIIAYYGGLITLMLFLGSIASTRETKLLLLVFEIVFIFVFLFIINKKESFKTISKQKHL